MSHLKRLALAGGLAVVAAIFNSLYLAAQAKPSLFVAVSTDIESGAIITDSAVRAVPVPGESDRLRQTLIPYSARNTVVGLPAGRDYLAGDVVFYRDLTPPEQRTRWEIIGPFRLISVNERSGLEGRSFEASRNSITIAVNAEFEGHTQRLLEVFGDPLEGDDVEPSEQITAVQVVPPESGSQPPQRFPNEVIQTIKLSGDVQLPPVLVKGDLIRFVLKDATQL